MWFNLLFLVGLTWAGSIPSVNPILYDANKFGTVGIYIGGAPPGSHFYTPSTAATSSGGTGSSIFPPPTVYPVLTTNYNLNGRNGGITTFELQPGQEVVWMVYVGSDTTETLKAHVGLLSQTAEAEVVVIFSRNQRALGFRSEPCLFFIKPGSPVADFDFLTSECVTSQPLKGSWYIHALCTGIVPATIEVQASIYPDPMEVSHLVYSSGRRSGFPFWILLSLVL